MELRNQGSASTILFVHSVKPYTNWETMARRLMDCAELDPWDMHTFEYTKRWAPHLVRFGIRFSPHLDDIAGQLKTFCGTTLGRYRTLVILAHSAGGLITQRALVDSKSLRRRTTHLLMFGTPTGGVPTTWYRRLVPQVRDTITGSRFLQQLEADWGQYIGAHPPFKLCLVSAIDDVTVASESVFHMFPDQNREMVSGDHSTMIQPKKPDDPIVELITSSILGRDACCDQGERIFLSYVREDENIVGKVSHALEAAGFNAWMDKRNLELGEDWQREIDNAIEASERFVVFVSEAALSAYREKGVFSREVLRGVKIQDDLAPGIPFLIPVRLEDCNFPELNQYQWFDLFTEDDIRPLVSHLAKSLE